MKVIAAISALLAAHSASASDMSFSMYGVKSGKGYTGKSGKGYTAKSSKGYTGGSAKSSKKGKFDDCVFSNPAIMQVFLLFPWLQEGDHVDKFVEDEGSRLRKLQESAPVSRELGSGSGIPLELLLMHAYSLNELFAWAVKHYVNKGKSAEEIWEFGEYILNTHPEWIQMVFEYCEFSCAKLFAIVGQMEDTCNDNKYMAAYVNVALALLSGFFNGHYDYGHHGHRSELHPHGHGLPPLNMLTCTYWYEHDTFDDIFGHYVTDEVRDLVDYGVTCNEGHGHGHGHGSRLDADFTFAFSEEATLTHFASLTDEASLTEGSMSG